MEESIALNTRPWGFNPLLRRQSHASIQHFIPLLSNTRSLAHNFKISHYPHAQPSSQTPSNLTISANHVTDATEILVQLTLSFFLSLSFPLFLLFRSKKDWTKRSISRLEVESRIFLVKIRGFLSFKFYFQLFFY